MINNFMHRFGGRNGTQEVAPGVPWPGQAADDFRSSAKKERLPQKRNNSQKSGSRNSTGCKAIASSMPKPKTRCTSVKAETTIMLTQRGTENLYKTRKKEFQENEKTGV
jgi:hypothetical protein